MTNTKTKELEARVDNLEAGVNNDVEARTSANGAVMPAATASMPKGAPVVNKDNQVGTAASASPTAVDPDTITTADTTQEGAATDGTNRLHTSAPLDAAKAQDSADGADVGKDPDASPAAKAKYDEVQKENERLAAGVKASKKPAGKTTKG